MKPRRRARIALEAIPGKVAEVERTARAGCTIADACRKAGVSLPTYYRWRHQLKSRKSPRAEPTRLADANREMVLSAAKAVFLRHGAGASLKIIAEAAGVTRQTIYNLFGGRDRLFGEVVQSLYLQLNAPILILDPEADLISVLEQVGRHHLLFSVDPEAVGLMRIALGEYADHPELAQVGYALRARPHSTNAVSIISKKLSQEIKKGAIRKVDPHLAAETFVGSFSAFPRHRALIGLPRPPHDELEKRLKLAIDIFVDGLGYRSPQKFNPVES